MKHDGAIWGLRGVRSLRYLFVAVLLGGAVFVGTAGANHIGGAFYNGTHSAPPPGQSGTVQFVTSVDGTQIGYFRLDNIAGSICTFTYFQFQGPIPISTTEPHSFTATSGAATLSGTFPAPQAAQGTAHLSAPFPPYGTCSADLTWTATTTAVPPPPPPPPPPPMPPPPPAPPVRCRVPNVIGRTLSTARARIRGANCGVGRVRRVRSARRRRGRVISQTPRAGSVKPQGTPVNLVIGRGR